ncbi:E3 SUMO-protein ligase pli1 [Beauveria bassiana D1-5]|uniref:MIZ/SP-RING zinc finger protein n=2 Tax=Beauveria bassiana TaxID=176275 RepID=J4UKN9_BEAB2|nr:MIZ/SP-RING zinc finger protein [Beauveria bassiana ARSEF 2860]EJP64822.1 MIZ/SP-RING zinc finger protein [Beauveria bassiana ARSEF 2860]KGQ05191.1 E3 SUMO-protein ligase pli1 [Beauveria bassiana D1-5]
MASADGVPRHEVLSLMREIQGNQLFNRQLSSICQVNGLKSTGVKAEMQRRIINLIQESSADPSRFAQVKQSISNAHAQRNGTAPVTTTTSLKSRTTAPTGPNAHFPLSVPYGNGSPGMSQNFGTPRINIMTTPALAFKPSPFYLIKSTLGDVRICEAMAQHRNTINLHISATTYPEVQQCLADTSHRVLLFCAGEAIGSQNIEFPHQAEIRVNGSEVKANLRGLKSKPGSTRPVDITDALRIKPPNYLNTIDFTYALTTKVYSVAELVQGISTGRRIPKDSVITELNQKAQDPDVVATSSVLSLKCPLSYTRLDVPCRGMSCSHVQCFDATSYLQLQEQGPQWLCPICNKPAPYEQLAVDEYVQDILDNTSKSLEGVIIEPNGRWLSKGEEAEANNFPSEAYFDDDDDDAIELSVITNTPVRPPDKLPTPSTPSRQAGGGTKRPAPAVIDLTLSSDDEDEEPIERARKRRSTVANGYHRSSSLLLPELLPPGLPPS